MQVERGMFRRVRATAMCRRSGDIHRDATFERSAKMGHAFSILESPDGVDQRGSVAKEALAGRQLQLDDNADVLVANVEDPSKSPALIEDEADPRREVLNYRWDRTPGRSCNRTNSRRLDSGRRAFHHP